MLASAIQRPEVGATHLGDGSLISGHCVLLLVTLPRWNWERVLLITLRPVSGMCAVQAGKSAQHSSGPQRADQQQLRNLNSQSSLPDKAALVTWQSFKSLAKPGDRLRLVGDSLSLAGEAGTSAEGVVMPAGSGMPLVIDGDVAAWVSSTAAGDSTSPRAASAALSGAERADPQDSKMSAWDGAATTGDEAACVGDGHGAWGHRLQAASSQAEKLLVLAEVNL